jgi:poly(A) polymerase
MTHVSGDWLSNDATQHVAKVLLDAGHQVFFVGGCVRNALLGVAVSDIDMSTDARPERVIKLFKAAGLKTIPTGLEHGTVTVVSGEIAHEITTFRHDLVTDGRRAKIAYSDNLQDDAVRRDFTMNALYADVEGNVIDPVDGLPDLQKRQVKFVGDPHHRIREDYLRILRFFRFYAWYGASDEGIDADGLAACADNLDGIASLSRERVGAEMIKLLSAKDPCPAIAVMAASGVLQCVMDGADPKALGPLIHFETTTVDWRSRAAVMGGDVASVWRLSKKDAAHLDALRNALGSTDAISTLAYRYGADLALNATLGRAAIFETPPAPDFEAHINQGAKAVFPVKAADLPDLEGPALGARLRDLEHAWIRSDFTLSKQALLAL